MMKMQRMKNPNKIKVHYQMKKWKPLMVRFLWYPKKIDWLVRALDFSIKSRNISSNQESKLKLYEIR
jgi:hypothetical protein